MLFPALQGDGSGGAHGGITSAGRMDMVGADAQVCHVMEFKKLDKGAEKAMRQITDKHYADSYLAVPAGVPHRRELCRKTRNIDDWTIEKG